MASRLVCLLCRKPHRVNERLCSNRPKNRFGNIVMLPPKIIRLYDQNKDLIGIVCYKKYAQAMRKVRKIQDAGTTPKSG